MRSSYPLRRVLSNAHAPSRVAEWSVELSHYNINFDNDKTIENKALAEFLAEWLEWTPTPMEESESHSALPGREDPDRWVMYFDGAFSYEGAGADILIDSPMWEHLKYVVQLDFDQGKSSINVAEYEGLLAGLRAATGLGIPWLVVRGDSRLIINQVLKEYNCPRMRAYMEETRKMELKFKGIQMEHVPRADNSIADQLSKIAAQREPAPPRAFIERLTRPTIDKGNMHGFPGADTWGGPPGSTPPGGEVSAISSGAPSWVDDIIKFLRGQELPDDDGGVERVARQAKMYVLVDGELHR